jgi:hypothetical protein
MTLRRDTLYREDDARIHALAMGGWYVSETIPRVCYRVYYYTLVA